MPFLRVYILVLLAVIVSACASQENLRQNAIDNLLSKNDGLFIGGQKLSPDGQYLVFDFVENYTTGQGDLREKHVFVVLYDLTKGKVEILSPLGKNVGTHSAGFDLSGQYLTMVTHCLVKSCPAYLYGNQIISLDLNSGDVEQITTAFMKHRTWGFRWGADASYKSRVKISGRVTLKGFPVYSPNRDYVYYVSNDTPYGSSIFHRQFAVHYELRRLKRTRKDGINIWVDEQAIKEDRDAVLFNGSGRISMLDTGNLLLSANKPLGIKWKYYEEREVSAFYFDTVTKKLSIAFDKFNTPISRNKAKANSSGTYSSSHSASIDGQRISLVRGGNKTVSVVENGKFRDVITAKDIGGATIATATLSGDGNWLAVFFSQRKVNDQEDVFWLINLMTGERKALPLRAPLRRALDKKFKN